MGDESIRAAIDGRLQYHLIVGILQLGTVAEVHTHLLCERSGGNQKPCDVIRRHAVDSDLLRSRKNILIFEIECRGSNQFKSSLRNQPQEMPASSRLAAEACNQDRSVEDKPHRRRLPQLRPHGIPTAPAGPST